MYVFVITSNINYRLSICLYFRNDVGFEENHAMRDHSNFVASVCIVPPTSIYEQGLILTGSNDNLIIVYNLQTYEKLYHLTGHEGTGK